jgi:putative GTP pyrophosphokinase
MEYTKSFLKEEYNKKAPLFIRTCNNIKDAMTIFLNEKNISFLTVSSRIKDFESFFEKIDRKSYSNPFDDNEDFCGIRVILYYLKDVETVNEIVKKEFDIQIDENKSEKLEANEFGYRSHHFIIKIKDKWLDTPNYRGLKDIKIEIQVRTILMHAWAEIEHKLGYKNKDQVPKELQRKLFMISAKLEEADGQFQDLKNKISDYKNELIVQATKNGTFQSKLFDLNVFQALLDYYFPDHPKMAEMANIMFNEIKKSNISLEEITSYAEKIKPLTQFIDKKIFRNKEAKTHQTNILSYAIEAFHQGYDVTKASESRMKIIEEIRQLAG